MLRPLYIIFVLLFSSACFAKAFNIHFYQEEKVPLVINGKNGKTSGIYYDALTKILDEAQINYQIKKAPALRRRRAFWSGETYISCCSNPSWRSKAQEQDVQFFSLPFMQLQDVIIYPKSMRPNMARLHSYKFALVRGYTYKDEKSFKKVTRLVNERAILEFINSKRANLGIVNKTIAQYYINKLNLDLEIGPIYTTDDIHIRVHKNRKALLKPINKSIKKLKEEGFFNDLKKSYVTKFNKDAQVDKTWDFLALTGQN